MEKHERAFFVALSSSNFVLLFFVLAFPSWYLNLYTRRNFNCAFLNKQQNISYQFFQKVKHESLKFFGGNFSTMEKNKQRKTVFYPAFNYRNSSSIFFSFGWKCLVLTIRCIFNCAFWNSSQFVVFAVESSTK